MPVLASAVFAFATLENFFDIQNLARFHAAQGANAAAAAAAQAAQIQQVVDAAQAGGINLNQLVAQAQNAQAILAAAGIAVGLNEAVAALADNGVFGRVGGDSGRRRRDPAATTEPTCLTDTDLENALLSADQTNLPDEHFLPYSAARAEIAAEAGKRRPR
ncbi:MAG: hypothetical protein M1828_001997 [Chrysothrix sp. TS-e1954]|nr:MAG: hypothetical protein M1828_001997 [Chrysothrix sp. TS-e1954]